MILHINWSWFAAKTFDMQRFIMKHVMHAVDLDFKIRLF